MSFCPVIEIFPDHISYFQTGDGRIILDIDGSTTTSLSKALNVEDDVYTIGSVEDIALTIPNSHKNFFYLKSLFDPATEKPNGLHLIVRISIGSETLFHDKLYGITKTAEAIEIRLVYSANWKSKLQQKLLKDLPLPIITLTQTYVEEVWANNDLYNDGDIGHWFPMVDYGGWREHNRIVVEDLRPFFHSLYLMQLMFDEIGWCLECPFYETTLGRRCIDYILRDDYGDIEELKVHRSFTARNELGGNGVVFYLTDIVSWELLTGNSQTFDPVSGRYISVFEGKFKLDIQVGGGSIFEAVVLKFSIFKRRYNAGVDEITLLGSIDVLSTVGTYLLEVETSVTPSEEVYVAVSAGNLEFIIAYFNITITFSNEVLRTFYAKGDTIPLKTVVDQEMSCYDYLLGNIHFMSGIVDEFPQYKKVRILTPFNADIFGETIEGYFQNTFVSLRSTQPINSTNSNVRNEDQLRFIKVAFAKTTDALSKHLASDENEYFSKTIDLGEPYLDDTEELRNPIFEFTVLKAVNHFIYQEISSGGTPDFYYIPQMTDNSDGKVSLKIAPRKIVAFGYDKQYGGQHGLIIWENNFITNIAFAAQHPGEIPFGDPATVQELKLVYGNELNDLWSLVLARFYIQFRQRLQLDFLNYLNNETFFRFNLRNIFEIEYDGHPIVGRIVTINDYQPCTGISAQLLLMPELKAGELCIDSVDPIQCDNDPEILGTYDGNNCWTFSIGGTFDCNITSITWEIQLASDDPATWTEIGTGNTVQVCGESDWFIIRATITYDCEECTTSVITKFVQPCTDTIQCELGFVFYNFNSWLGYKLIGSYPECDITIVVKIYDQEGTLLETLNGPFNNGSYNGWELIEIAQNDVLYVMQVTVDCDNGCADLFTQCSIAAFPQSPPPPPSACEHEPILNCVPVTINGVTCYTFTLENAGDYQYFIVTWECDGGGGQWMPGDDPICCSGILTANAMVHYCDCEPICTPFTECDPGGCTIVSAGTALQFIACN